ncbi:MAG: exopolyphosphatase [Bacteroidota bacterium]
MKVGVIDLGTNTFHLMIAIVESDSHEIIHRERKPVKIGEKGINQGEITSQAWDRAIQALKEFKQKIVENKIEKVFGTATSAIRNASNGQKLVEQIKEETGIEIEVISGQREAELIHLGASSALDIGDEKSLIMDIGGGSIEFIIANKHQSFWMRSFEIGGQRLVERFHHTDPIDQNEINNLASFFDNELSDLFDTCDRFKPTTLIGCSGTFDTLSDIYREKKNITKEETATELPFDDTAFSSIYKELIQKTRNERLQIPGMIEMRVDMIVVACVLVEYVINKCGLSNIRVSAFALKEGILFNALDQLRKEQSSSKID